MKEIPAKVVASVSTKRLAMAESIMSEDRALLRSLATAENFDEQIEAARAVMERRKNALGALSKI